MNGTNRQRWFESAIVLVLLLLMLLLLIVVFQCRVTYQGQTILAISYTHTYIHTDTHANT